MHIRRTFQVKLSYQIDGAMTGLLQKYGDIPPWSKTECPGLQVVLQIAFHTVVASGSSTELLGYVQETLVTIVLPMVGVAQHALQEPCR